MSDSATPAPPAPQPWPEAAAPISARTRRKMVRRAVIPSLLTLGNLVCGCSSIFFVMFADEADAGAGFAAALNAAAWLIFLGMVFDMLDGQVARLTKSASAFGAQLDSLCDAITFGVAPAALVYRTIHHMQTHLEHLGAQWWMPNIDLGTMGGRFLWALCIYYPVCAILRLARFNVGNDPGEDAHRDFKGLPSPAAAGVIASLILLLYGFNDGRLLRMVMRETVWAQAITLALPVTAFLVATLMVSRIRYLHLTTWAVRGKRPPAHLVTLILGLLLFAIFPQPALALGFIGYALAGPFLTLKGWVVHRRTRFDAGENLF